VWEGEADDLVAGEVMQACMRARASFEDLAS